MIYLKQVFMLGIFFLVASFSVQGQEFIFGDSSVVSRIKEKTSQIYENKDKTQFFLSKKKLQKKKTFGTSIIAHSKEGLFNRIITFNSDQNGQLATEWYFWKTQLIYVYQSYEFYQEAKKKSSWKNFKNLWAWESRYYFEDETLKFQKHKGKSAMTKQKEVQQLLEDAYSILAFVKESS